MPDEATSPEITITLRPVNELDIDGVARIDKEVSGTYRPAYWETKIGYYVRRDPYVSQVAEVDGEIAGFMLGEMRSGEFGLEVPAGWIEVLGVSPSHRGHGLGRKLGEALLERFRERGAERVMTLVDLDSMEALGRFFEKLGFEATAVKAFARSL
ncbi:MAG: GNAT family N-acetyltransferase [Planctomycetota bacterium]